MDPTTSRDTSNALPEDLAERISARLDGELSPPEAAEVDRQMADNPAAQSFADDLRGLSNLCRADPSPVPNGDLSAAVVAEALRRQAQNVSEPVQPASQLEPEGDFGLPFGKSSQNWAWAGVAAAAAIVMFLGNRGEQAGSPVIGPRPTVEQALAHLQQADPRLQVVDYQVSRDRLQQLRQLLAQRAARTTTLPVNLMKVSQQAGVRFQPADPANLVADGVTEEVLAVDADEKDLNRLLREFNQKEGGSVVQVESERPGAAAEATPASTKPSIGGMWRVQLAPDGKTVRATPRAQLPQGRRMIVLRIRVTPKP